MKTLKKFPRNLRQPCLFEFCKTYYKYFSCLFLKKITINFHEIILLLLNRMYLNEIKNNIIKFSCLNQKKIFLALPCTWQGCYFTWKNLEFVNLGKKNLEFKKFQKKKPGNFNNFYNLSSKISIWHKSISYRNFFLLLSKFFCLIKTHLK